MMNIPKINATNNFNFKSIQQTKTSKYINKERLQDTFIKMAKIDTTSNEEARETQIPSSYKQVDFAKKLAEELKSMGLTDIELDEHGILTATLQGNIGEESPVVGLIAHMDTSPDASGENVNPQIHNYKGGDIILKNGVKIPESDLINYKNQTIITSDGTTLLGADDKAGIAEILEALKVFQERPELKRPTIRIAFTNDEEIGYGVDKFDIKKFGADLAYTIDGTEPDKIDCETFNAYNPEITIKGVNVHTGFAYGKMVNAIEIANKIINKLPENEKPENTKDRQGFYHVDSIKGDSSEVKIKLLVRDFDENKIKERIKFLKNITDEVIKDYSEAQIEFKPNEKYHNMRENLNKLPQVIDIAKEGISLSGIDPQEASVRGGTDGSELTLMGLPTPNLGAGGINFHSVKEFVSAETMQKCCENIINIVNVWAEKANEVMPAIKDLRKD